MTSLRVVLPLAASFGCGLLVAGWLGAAAADREPDPYHELDTFARALSLIEANYVEPVEHAELVRHAIEGMVEKLDDHSRWLDERAYQAMLGDTEGRYFGIGVEVRAVPEGALVIRVLPGGPASRDGLRYGDVILKVDGAPIGGAEIDTLSTHLRGARGTALELTIQRPGVDAPIVVQTLRDRIDIQPVEWALLSDKVGYVHLYSFQDSAAREVQRATQNLLERGATGIVLDLRDNPGGLLEEAIGIADLFLEDGTIVSTRGRADQESLKSATPAGFGLHLPLVILVNQGSASASEVVAGALQDTGRAQLVGTRTYGKGTVQNLFPMRSGDALKLTTARYYTPSGEPVAFLKGRDPDVEVDLEPQASTMNTLRQRINALSIPVEERSALLALIDALPDPDQEPVAPAWHLDPLERLAVDPQLSAAIRVLRDR
ncbi:MAG: S41 family peptidase [Deltaproteobacteria bacterium]|nr:MAG: S41 family peptidase [Deltaproteobacteria bacterium]